MACFPADPAWRLRLHSPYKGSAYGNIRTAETNPLYYLLRVYIYNPPISQLQLPGVCILSILAKIKSQTASENYETQASLQDQNYRMISGEKTEMSKRKAASGAVLRIPGS